MNYKKMLYEQLSKDFNVSVEDLQAGKNLFVKKEYREGRRLYRSDRCKLNIMSTNGMMVMCSEDEQLLEWLRERFEDSKGEWICEEDKLRSIEGKLNELGHEIVYSHPFFIPGKEVNLTKPDAEFVWYEQEELFQFQGDERFTKALEFSKERPDMLAVTAVQGGEIIGMAAASADSPTSWQIGIDVVPQARQQGIASYLVWLLREEIAKRGYLPFYGTGASHIQSQRVAVNAGFIPAWWELYSGEKGKDGT